MWKFLSSVPLKLRLALNLRTRFEDLFIFWADVVTDSSSRIRWIWDKHGYLKYASDSAEGMFLQERTWPTVTLGLDRAFLFLRLKRSFLDEMPVVDRNFPYNEDQRPVDPSL